MTLEEMKAMRFYPFNGQWQDGWLGPLERYLRILLQARMISWDSWERVVRYLDENTDLSTARRAAVRKWQQRWEWIGRRNASYRISCFIPDMNKWFDRRYCEFSYELNKVLISHGRFRTLIKRTAKVYATTRVLYN